MKQAVAKMKEYVDSRQPSDDYEYCMKIMKDAFVSHGLDNAFNDYFIYSPMHYFDKEKPRAINSAA